MVAGANFMSGQYRKLFDALLPVAAAIITPASAQDTRKSKPEPLMIQGQGSFAVGGLDARTRAHPEWRG